MPSIPYGSGAYKRSTGNLPPLTLINMFIEKAETSENQVAIQSRSGLSQTMNVGSGPINGIFSEKGTFGGDVFSISGQSLYRGTELIGPINGNGPTSWGGGPGELLVTRGQSLYSYNGTDLVEVSFPDDAPVRAVCFIGSLYVAVRGDGAFPGRFYWSNLLDGRTWDALNFATAEREPDELRDIAALGDNIWLPGDQSFETWAHTGSGDLPFSRNENQSFDKGVIGTGCIVPADNSLFFVGSNCSVYRVADVPQRISEHWLEEKIRNSASVSMFTHHRDGHEFVCVRLSDTTYEYDCATLEWNEQRSGQGQWIVSCAAMVGSVAYLGHQSTGQIMGWSGWDDVGIALERRFTAAKQLDQPLSVDRLSLWVNTGQTDVLSGQGSAPEVEMRYSRDGGNTWSDYEGTPLGAAGNYRAVAEWRRLGQFDFPGMIFEFRCTDPVPFRVSAVKVNDPAGGRSR